MRAAPTRSLLPSLLLPSLLLPCLLLPCLLLLGCPGSTVGGGAYLGEVWADNWSSMSVDGTEVMEDSVPITTERSFNQETFSFDATLPFQIAVVMKDFKEDDSGLEYIGEANQQMGDGGYIAQITDRERGEVVAVSSSSWRCLVIHEAPLNKECEDAADPISECESSIQDEPDGWMAADYDDSSWEAATEYSEAQVDPKDGYDEIAWDASAALIWTGDLESDNTILCRFTVE